jgi:hypothetical protein
MRRLRYIFWENLILAGQCAAVLNNPDGIDEPLPSELQSRSMSVGILREQPATLLCSGGYLLFGTLFFYWKIAILFFH